MTLLNTYLLEVFQGLYGINIDAPLQMVPGLMPSNFMVTGFQSTGTYEVSASNTFTVLMTYNTGLLPPTNNGKTIDSIIQEVLDGMPPTLAKVLHNPTASGLEPFTIDANSDVYGTSINGTGSNTNTAVDTSLFFTTDFVYSGAWGGLGLRALRLAPWAVLVAVVPLMTG
jgi:hypothetical protein